MRRNLPTAVSYPNRLARLALVLLACCITSTALAAGYQRLDIPASSGYPPINAIVWSPCARPAGPVKLGPYVIHGVRDCIVAGQALPLIVISHGQGGSFLGHHDTAEALADAGFVVVTLNHRGDTFGDDSAAQQLRIFESRPLDVSRTISYLLTAWPGRQALDARAIGVFGFSRGGYTALALAGGVPNAAASAARYCAPWWSFVLSLCRQLDREDARIKPRADPRIRAAVVVDPLNLFDAAGLKSVRIPVQLWASEQGGDGVALPHVEAVRAALPNVTDYHVARGAGHFAYLAPCPPEFAKSATHLCEDPAGFDRVAWHKQMNAAVVAFFRRQLQTGSRSTTP